MKTLKVISLLFILLGLTFTDAQNKEPVKGEFTLDYTTYSWYWDWFYGVPSCVGENLIGDVQIKFVAVGGRFIWVSPQNSLIGETSGKTYNFHLIHHENYHEFNGIPGQWFIEQFMQLIVSCEGKIVSVGHVNAVILNNYETGIGPVWFWKTFNDCKAD